MLTTRLGIVAALATGLIGLCATLPVEPHWEPAGAYPVRPDSMWLAEYHKAELCSKTTGHVERVTWHLVPGDRFTDENGMTDIGIWAYGHNIYVSDAWKTTAWVIRHESLHDLVGPHDGGKKDSLIFGIACQARWGYLASDDPSYVP